MNAFVGISGATTRAAPPTHQEWVPLEYMSRAVDFLCSHYVGGLPLRPGGRKTSITLAAFRRLQDERKARTMLVVAPLRVCRQVWRQEAAKWSQFRHLEFALLHGPKKASALKSGADVYLINPEGIAWLTKQYMGRPLPFDVVAIDELTKFQNAQAERHKALRPRLKGVPYRWGLTGSLFAKGYVGIFGQQLILDDGAALGRYITHFRDQYFQVAYNGFDYDLLPGAEKRIIEKMAPYWFYVDEKDYAQLPGLLDVPRVAEMDSAQRKLYDRMKHDMIVSLPEGELEAANTGAAYSKLAQMANGAVYMEDRTVAHIHDLKLDMVEELVDELNGEPLLVGYEFNHDLERLRARFGKDLPYLGKGTTAKQEDMWVQQWNRGELPLMLMHPQSAGHGLNMQEGHARHIAWFSVTWDWEAYDQFIRRVRRSGNDNAQVFNHILAVKHTIDEEKLAAVRDKDFTERRLVVALNHEILRESQDQPRAGEADMVAKLTRPDNAAPAPGGWGQQAPQQAEQPSLAAQPPRQEPDPAAAPQQPPANGWGAAVGPDPNAGQRERIQEHIAPQPDRAAEAAAAFSGGVTQQAEQIAQTDYGPVGGEPAPQQPDPNADRPVNGGWASPAPQQEPAAVVTPPPPQSAPNGWGGVQSTQADRHDAATAAQQSGQPPFDPDTQPAGVETAKPLSKMKKDELVEYAQNLEAQVAGGAVGFGGGSDESSAVVYARAMVLSAVVKTSPDMGVADLVDTSREMMDFVLRG